MKPGSVSIPVASSRLGRPSLVTQQASQGIAGSVVISSGSTYQSTATGTTYSSTAAPVVRVISSQATSPAVTAYSSGTRTVVSTSSTPAVSTAYPTAYSTSLSGTVISAQTGVASLSTSAPSSATASLSKTVGSMPAAASLPRAAGATTTVVRSTQAAPIVRVQARSQAAPLVGRTVRVSAASSTGPRAVAVSGPTYTQGAYEAKHQNDDPQLKSLKELRRTSGLKDVPVVSGLSSLKSGAEDGKLTREKFMESYNAILENHGVEAPPDTVRTAVWELFDRDGNEVVDMMELVCGISLLCAGTEEEKIHAVFEVFDENSDGFISLDEMFKFLTSVFKVVLTPNVLGVMNSMGVNVASAEDLASVTALECFKSADLNHDGKLSISEFKNWFYTPRNDPTLLFCPTQKILQ
mmetsp:Transcript_79446/g.210938  ORF Transcript_79446/g.210938 Transcript_79446/m.210938 type:complete len:409 (-) Transcript_79446:85-1311(-)